MNILVLGGIAESKELARRLIQERYDIIYSIAGVVRQPDLTCTVHSGGFSRPDDGVNGVQGMVQYIADHDIELLIDATHPYAQEISNHAALATSESKIPCWRYNRPGWHSGDYSGWHDFHAWEDLLPRIRKFARPFFSMGISTLRYVGDKPEHQSWIIRSARRFEDMPGIIQVNAIGPFSLADEIKLMQTHAVDALISKNSGCSRVAAKLDAAATLDIPVFVQSRPESVSVDKSFTTIEALIETLKGTSKNVFFPR